jgi:hypothetical protein
LVANSTLQRNELVAQRISVTTMIVKRLIEKISSCHMPNVPARFLP